MKKIFYIHFAQLFLISVYAQVEPPTEAERNDGALEGSNDYNDARQDQRDGEAEDRENIDDALGDLNNYLSTLRDIADAYRGMQNFSPGECAPDFATGGAAMMPSTCDGNSNCSQCFESAVNELNFVRRILGRLSCIYNNTKRFTQSAIAFGDNVSGIHGVTGLSWQNARGGIVQEYDNFKQTYDRKYTDLMGSLQRALMAIDGCERRYGLTDWYQRFGFIYFEFMKDKYKRTD
ncbi:MAG: hypothetical protein ABL876_00590 [Chitinophagaceae bacterium]